MPGWGVLGRFGCIRKISQVPESVLLQDTHCLLVGLFPSEHNLPFCLVSWWGHTSHAGSPLPPAASEPQCIKQKMGRKILFTLITQVIPLGVRSGHFNRDFLMMSICWSPFQLNILESWETATLDTEKWESELTFVHRPWYVEGSVHAAVHALPSISDHELLQGAIQKEGAAPVNTHHGQIAVHRKRGTELGYC